jgi:hypothetical protein
LPSSSKHGKPNNTNQFNIIFKPKTKSTTNHGEKMIIEEKKITTNKKQKQKQKSF